MSRVRRRSTTRIALVGGVALASLIQVGCSDSRASDGSSDDSSTTEKSAVASNPNADLSVDLSGAKVAQTVSDRFQSYNLEMASVVGGTFWAPRDDPSGEAMSVHPPVELDEKLTNLTKKLGPSYLRVSGSWANKVYFDDTGRATEAPDGFQSVLTGERWSEVGRFADGTGNRMVTSFAVGAGTRAPDGSWTPDLAKRFLSYTVENKVPVDAAEFINEPNIQGTAGATYDSAGFARDFATLKALRDEVDPKLELLGPGGMVVGYEVMKPLDDPTTEELLETSADLFDAFSFHSYTGMSDRCSTLPQVPVDRLMDRSVLGVMVENIRMSTELRDRFMPGKKIWLTETATAACGGDQTASKFEGAFAYLEHLGDAARNGVWVHMYNTLVASDYGIIDDRTHMPRPSYFTAYLWKKNMGTKALDVTPSAPGGGEVTDKVSAYGHCKRDTKTGAVAMAITNRDAAKAYTVDLGSKKAAAVTMTADSLESDSALFNGKPLDISDSATFKDPAPRTVDGTALELAPRSITFVTLPAAKAKACTTKP